jgi:hypothetical protein
MQVAAPDNRAMPKTTREIYHYDTLNVYRIEETGGRFVFVGITDAPLTYVGEFAGLMELWNRLGDDGWLIADAPWVEVENNDVVEPIWGALINGRARDGKNVEIIRHSAKHRMTRRSFTWDSEPDSGTVDPG